MRILLLIDSLNSGGAQRQIVGLARFLKELNYDIILGYYYNLTFFKSFLLENNVKHLHIEGAENKLLRLFKIAKVVKENRIDVIISYLDTPNILNCFLTFFFPNLKIVVSERNVNQSNNWKDSLKFNLYRNANRIICNSYSQTKFIEENYPFLKHKLATITNFVETEYFIPTANNKKKNNLISIVGIGRVIRQKNILLLVKAFKIVKEKGYKFKMTWYGENFLDSINASLFSKEYKEVNDLILKFGLESDFILLSPLKDIRKAYWNSDILILPSIYEGFSNVICEALSIGIPVIASQVGDNSFLVKNGINGFTFSHTNEKELASKIIEYIELSDVQKERMSNECRQFAIKFLSKKQFITKYVNLINNL